MDRLESYKKGSQIKKLGKEWNSVGYFYGKWWIVNLCLKDIQMIDTQVICGCSCIFSILTYPYFEKKCVQIIKDMANYICKHIITVILMTIAIALLGTMVYVAGIVSCVSFFFFFNFWFV